mgnify:CR=1 FL=1
MWGGARPGREGFHRGRDYGDALQELRGGVAARFERATTEVRVKQARDVALHGLNLAKKPVRNAAGGILGRVGRR